MTDTEPGAVRPVAYLFGDDTQSGVQQTDDIRCRGITDIYRLRSNAEDFIRVHVPRNYLRTPVRHDMRRLSVVINLVTDADQNPRVLAAASTVLKGFKGVVLNAPERIARTTRPQVACALQNIDGLVVPTTIGLPASPASAAKAIDRAGMAFPAILRRAGTHAGRSARIVHSVDEVVANMQPRADHVLTQFVDLRCAHGLYRKFRVFCFGDRVVFRHLIVSDHWSVHAEARERLMASNPSLCDEEARAFRGGLRAISPWVGQVIAAIRKALGLDFFGVDFGIRLDGQLVLFEANSTMNFLPMSTDPAFPHAAATFADGRDAVDAMVADAFVRARRFSPS
jgi:hypothetical protein